jgi:chitinase
LVCSYVSWAAYRPGRGKFEVSNIDPKLCTHLIYGFFGIGVDGSFEVLDPTLDLHQGNIKKFNELKKINPKLKTLAAVYGLNEVAGTFSVVARDPLKRKKFARQARKFLQKHGFDGLDIDWEHPTEKVPEDDKQNYVQLLSDIKRE